MRKSFAALSSVAVAAMLLAFSAFGADPKPGDAVGGLLLTLGSAQAKGALIEDVALVSTFRNVGAQAVSLPNWRARSFLITDAQGKVVPPGKGPVLPCGAGEGATVLTPGNERQENQGLIQTQPAGNPAQIGFRYDLLPGVYKVALIYEVKEPDKLNPWAGKIISNEITLTIAGPPDPVMAAIKAEWPQAAVISMSRMSGKAAGLWRIALESKTGAAAPFLSKDSAAIDGRRNNKDLIDAAAPGEKTQSLSVSLTETGVVTRVRKPLQPAEAPQAISNAVMDFYSSGPRTSVPGIEIQKANKVETRVDLQRAKLPQPVISYEVYVAGIKPAVWLYVSAEGKVSRTDDAAGSSAPPPAPNPRPRMPATGGPPKTAG